MPVLKFSQIRSGLWTGEHRRRMGEAVWLYGWLQSHVDRKTGVLSRYTHADAAMDLEAPERSIRRWLATLKAERYIEIEQHRYHLEVTITNYRPSDLDRQEAPIPPDSDRPDLATLEVETGQICPPDWPDLSARLATDGHPITNRGDQREQKEEAVVVGPDRAARLCDLLQARQVPFHLRRWDREAVNASTLDLDAIADCYAATYAGDFGTDRDRETLTIERLLDRVPAFLASRTKARNGWGQDGAAMVAEWLGRRADG